MSAKRVLFASVGLAVLITTGMHAPIAVARRYVYSAGGDITGYACKHSNKNAAYGCGVSNQLNPSDGRASKNWANLMTAEGTAASNAAWARTKECAEKYSPEFDDIKSEFNRSNCGFVVFNL